VLFFLKKIPEHHSSLHTSEKELPEWRSSTFCHKNTPFCINPQYLSGIISSGVVMNCRNMIHRAGSMQLNGTKI
jgi:hypothetical protein